MELLLTSSLTSCAATTGVSVGSAAESSVSELTKMYLPTPNTTTAIMAAIDSLALDFLGLAPIPIGGGIGGW